MVKQTEKVKYSDIVTTVLEEKLYFKDAMDWYCVKYLNITAEKAYFVLLSVMSFLILVFLYFTIINILPLKESFPILIKRDNVVDYYTDIKAIKPTGLKYTSNEAILRFLLINYTRELFTHNYKSGNMSDLNTKLTKIKNYSTDEVFQQFRNSFNELSGNMFNKNVSQNVFIKSFKFVNYTKQNFLSNIKDYVVSTMPTGAEITYSTVFIDQNGERTINNEKILLTFKYEAIKYNNISKEFTKPNLIITDYKIIKN